MKTTKTAEEILFVKGIFNELHENKMTGLSKSIQEAMHAHTSQFLDLAAEIINKREIQFLHSDYREELVNKILELKKLM